MTNATTAAFAAPIRTIIVDDEELARQVLREFLAAHDDVSVVAECANGFEAVIGARVAARCAQRENEKNDPAQG